MATKIRQNNRFKALAVHDNVPKIAQALKAREVPTNELKLSPKTARTDDTYRECSTTGDFFLTILNFFVVTLVIVQFGF